MSTALAIFAKAPEPGLAKTRLIPALGAAGAAQLAARMLEHALDQGLGAGFDRVELCAAPDGSHAAFQGAARRRGLALVEQGGGDLGARMHRAFVRLLARHARVCLIGTDAPALRAETLRAAVDALARHDAVFVPAHDGGYVLAGLCRPQPQLFDHMVWSTAQVMDQTRERLRAAGLSWAELPAVADIDEPADLPRLPAGWLT